MTDETAATARRPLRRGHRRRLELCVNGNIGRTPSVAGMPKRDREDTDGH